MLSKIYFDFFINVREYLHNGYPIDKSTNMRRIFIQRIEYEKTTIHILLALLASLLVSIMDWRDLMNLWLRWDNHKRNNWLASSTQIAMLSKEWLTHFFFQRNWIHTLCVGQNGPSTFAIKSNINYFLFISLSLVSSSVGKIPFSRSQLEPMGIWEELGFISMAIVSSFTIFSCIGNFTTVEPYNNFFFLFHKRCLALINGLHLLQVMEGTEE